MSNSEYEIAEMEYLIESGTEPEGNEEPDSNEEDQEEDLETNETRGQKTEEHPASMWARWIEKTEKETEYAIKNQRAERERDLKENTRKREEAKARSLKRAEARRPGNFPV